jgi:hypothetical protein
MNSKDVRQKSHFYLFEIELPDEKQSCSFYRDVSHLFHSSKEESLNASEIG